MNLMSIKSLFPTRTKFSATWKIVRQLFREFRTPLAIAIGWTVYNLGLVGQPLGKWLDSNTIDKAFITFFAISFWFAQWNRVKKQLRVEEGLTGIENKAAEMLNSLEAKTNHLLGHITGGDAFCHAYPQFIGSDLVQWVFVHSGKFPLYDVQVRICDLRKAAPNVGFNLNLGIIFPGRGHSYGSLLGGVFNHGSESVHAFNLFFVARNGSWTQEIRWELKPNVLAVANRVVRDGDPITQPLLCEISPEYPGDAPLDNTWGLPPGLIRNTG